MYVIAIYSYERKEKGFFPHSTKLFVLFFSGSPLTPIQLFQSAIVQTFLIFMTDLDKKSCAKVI